MPSRRWPDAALPAWLLLAPLLAAAACKPAQPASPAGKAREASRPVPAPQELCPADRARKLAAEADIVRKVDLERAVALYREAREQDPSDAALAMSLAELLAKREAWGEAASAARDAAELSPGRADAWARWAEWSAKAAQPNGEGERARWQDAEDGARRCLSIDPRRAECHLLLGRARLRAGDEAGAVAALHEAASQEPSALRYRVPLAGLYALLEESERASMVLEDGLRLAPEADPERVSALVTLGSLRQSQGSLAAATDALERAKAADRDHHHHEILYSLGALYAQLSPPRKSEALQMLTAFRTRACKGSEAARYQAECEQIASIAARLGASFP